jgi:hypothetical protein
MEIGNGKRSESLIAASKARLKRFFIFDCQLTSEKFSLLEKMIKKEKVEGNVCEQSQALWSCKTQ